MTPTTIQQLNQLNQTFYQTVAEPFSESRGQAWEGWKELVPILEVLFSRRSEIRVLDLGCGNGRFGHFLAEHFSPELILYTGFDSSKSLLEDAHQSLTQPFKSLQLTKVDLVDEFESDSSSWQNQTWDLVGCFGVIHHIPSFELRQKCIHRLAQSLSPDGIGVVAAWQFLANQRQAKKIVDPAQAGVLASQLEENDYILSWKRGVSAHRYCHQVTEKEFASLLPANATIQATYLADGKEGNLNRYWVISG